jgi:hypothetical protein
MSEGAYQRHFDSDVDSEGCAVTTSYSCVCGPAADQRNIGWGCEGDLPVGCFVR